MTKVQIRLELTGPLDESLLQRLSDTHGKYGMSRILKAPDGLVVEYDASRLTPAQVEATLHRIGVPARRV